MLNLYSDLNIHQFSIGDISSLGGEYKRGGIAREIKQQMKMNFVSNFHHIERFQFSAIYRQVLLNK